MIIEYRKQLPDGSTRSVVLRTYKDVAYVKRDTGDTVHLFGQYVDTENIPTLCRFCGEFFIACIHLAPGEYLECLCSTRLTYGMGGTG